MQAPLSPLQQTPPRYTPAHFSDGLLMHFRLDSTYGRVMAWLNMHLGRIEFVVLEGQREAFLGQSRPADRH